MEILQLEADRLENEGIAIIQACLLLKQGNTKDALAVFKAALEVIALEVESIQKKI